MKTVYEIIKKLRDTSSTKSKLEIIQNNKDNVDLRRFLRMTYEPRINFYLSKVQPNLGSKIAFGQADREFDDDLMSEVYDTLAKRDLTGNAARKWLADLYHDIRDDGGKELLQLLIQRDVQAGISTTTINKAWPGLITAVPYMRCLSGDWEILCEDGVPRKISDIVENQYQGKVLSFDTKTDQQVWMPIINHFDNGYSEEWVTIIYEEDGVIKNTKALTKEHHMFLADGKEVKVGDLNIGDLLF